MGIITKIEDKLSGNKHHAESKPAYTSSERRSIEKQAEYQNHNTPGSSTTGYGSSDYGSSNNPTSGAPGQTYTSSGNGSSKNHPTSGQTYGSSGTGGQVAQDIRHPVQAATSHHNEGYGTQYGNDKTRPVEPVDPYSTKGQNAMAAASSGGQGYGHSGQPESRDYAGQSDIGSLHHGHHDGTTNPGNDSGFRSGNHSSLEDRDAIPIAGGRRVGEGGSDRGHDQHHYGRDAAIAGGTGALGAGAYENHEHRDRRDHEGGGHHHGTHHRDGQTDNLYRGQDPYQPSGVSSAEQYGSRSGPGGALDSRDYGRGGNDQLSSGGNQYGGGQGRNTGGGLDNREYGRGGSDQLSSGGDQHGDGQGHHAGGASAIPTEKKVGSAYEAGYRDALAHLEAERR